MSLREKVILKVYKRWYEQVDLETAKKVHLENVAAIQDSLEKRKDPNRPFHIVGIAGSSRNTTTSCAYEKSNSRLMLERAAKQYDQIADVTFELIDLSDKFIEPCNGCYSSAGSLCRFPCDCFLDSMHPIYAALTLADGMLFATGVNENMPSSRMKLMIDRLISIDGGRFAPQYNIDGKDWKNVNAKQGEMTVSQGGQFEYVQRLSGKVAGALVSAKDYGAFKVGWDMLQTFNDYGVIIPSNAVAYWHSPRVAKDTAFDKSDLIRGLESGFVGKLCDDVARKVLALARLVRGQEDTFADVMVGRT